MLLFFKKSIFFSAPGSWLLFIAFIYHQQGYSQSPYFKQITINRESTSLMVNSVYTDHNGFLWIGTNEGVYQSDGMEFTQYLLNSPGATNYVSALYEDANGIIWVGYKDGRVALFNGDSLQPLNTEEGFPVKPITALLADHQGTVWIATAGEGVYYYQKHRLYNLNVDDGLNDNYCYCLLEPEPGKIWVGTDQGIAVCDSRNKNKIIDRITTNEGLPDEIIRVLRAGEEGIVWIGMEQQGVTRYNVKKRTLDPLPIFFKDQHRGAVNDICFGEKEVWIATEDSGLIYFPKDEKQKSVSFSGGDNFKLGKVSSLTLDHQQNVWLSCNAGLVNTVGMGLTFLTSIQGLKINFVHTLLVDKEGSLFLTPDQGLIKIAADKNHRLQKYEFTPPEDEIDIVSLYEDDAGYLWVGTLGAGLYRLNHKTGARQKINLPKENLSILSIAGNRNEIWLGTLGGAVKIDLKGNLNTDTITYEVTGFEQQKEIGNFYIYCVFIDSKKRVWFGSDQNGLACYADGKFSNPFSAVLKNKTIYSITEDKQGNIWCSVADEGAVRLGETGIQRFGTAEGMRELSISSICTLDDDRVAFVHKRGIDIIHTLTGLIDYFGSENNLSTINPDLNSKSVDSEKNIWLGTEKGIIVIHPGLGAGSEPAKVVIKHVLLYNNHQNKTHQHKFKYNENAIAIEYAGLWFTDPSRINYQYKLEGFNTSWIDTKDKRIVFSSLSPGKYVFKVRVSTHKNFINSSEASYEFYIARPYWQQAWFRISAILLMAGLIYFFIRKRDDRLRRLELLKNEKIQFQFETLRNQVNPHFLFNSFNTLISIIEDDKDLAVEYVEKLSDFFRNIVTYKDKDLISLNEEIKTAATYYFLQQKRYGKNLDLRIELDEMDREKQVPPMVLQLLIENAIKHNAISKETPLRIQIFSFQNHLVVKNNINPKRQTEPSTGTGLLNIASRYQLLNKELIKIKDDGKEFSVSLPL